MTRIILILFLSQKLGFDKSYTNKKVNILKTKKLPSESGRKIKAH